MSSSSMYATDLMEQVVKGVMEVLNEKYKLVGGRWPILKEDIETHLVDCVGDKFINVCEMAAEWDELCMDYDDPRQMLDDMSETIVELEEKLEKIREIA